MYASYELILLSRNGESLSVAPGVMNDILAGLTKLTGYRLDGYPGNRWEVFRWPDYIEHMKHISRCFDDIVFLLNREGERPGDLRKDYFYRGDHFSDAARIEFKDPRESVRELLNSNEKQSADREIVKEDEQEPESRSSPVTNPPLDKLQFVTG